jgi:hypothetical protein
MHRGEAATGARQHVRILILATAFLLTAAILLWPSPASGEETYPRLANIYFGTLIGQDLELFSRWDVVVLTKRAQAWYQDEMVAIRQLNPDIKFLVHMPIGYCGDWTDPEINELLVDAINQNGWWMYDTRGERVMMPFGSALLNQTLWCPENAQGQRLCEWMPGFIAENLGPGGCWDGVYLDYCMDKIEWANAYVADPIDSNLDGMPDGELALDAAWRGGQHMLVTGLRQLVGDDYIIATNGNNTFFEICNGSTREDFPNMHGGWYQNIVNREYGYASIDERYRRPTVNIVNAIWRGAVGPNGPIRDGSYDQQFGFAFASTLVFGDGYFSIDGGEGLPEHSQCWWHEYYDIDLGQPTGAAETPPSDPGDAPWVELGEMVKIRRFTGGLALVNPSSYTQTIQLGARYHEPRSWTGRYYPLEDAVDEFVLPPQSGSVLVGSGRLLEMPKDLVTAEMLEDRGGVRIEWQALPDATGYAIYHWELRNGTMSERELLDVVDEPLYIDTQTIRRELHYYQVAPIDANGCEGQPSRPVEVSIDPGSVRPIERRAEESGGRLTLTGRTGLGLACSPHPVRERTTISFDIPDDDRWAGSSSVSLTIYDIAGRVVRHLVDARLPPGRHDFDWDATSRGGNRVASGCYLYALAVDGEVFTNKLLVIN